MTAEIQEIQVACFRLGDDVYAVDIMRIKEIINPLRITPVRFNSAIMRPSYAP